ncbi:MAG TPA: homoserine kinase, partial [Coriobacteriia bacterium]|nr:homoserine kinase [Coriobacteriia bacterium]
YRRCVVTDLDAVRDALVAAGAAGAVLSGAGPTVIGLVAGSDDADALARAQEVAQAARASVGAVSGRLPPVAIALDRAGATLL